LQYITGLQPFWDFELIVNPDVLIPRWDSETVIEQALRLLPENQPGALADICTGSGACGGNAAVRGITSSGAYGSRAQRKCRARNH
jgi:release factor glutamine methyltransferase